MTKGGQLKTVTVAVLVALLWMTGKAGAAQCGSTAAGFEAWKRQFADEARARGVSASTLAALMATSYASATIAADRNQGSSGTPGVHPATLRRPAGAAAGDLGNGDGLRQVARKSEHAVGRGYSRL